LVPSWIASTTIGASFERDRDEHLALALGQLVDRGREGLELLSLLEPVSRSGR
jgi:hypothetical protein